MNIQFTWTPALSVGDEKLDQQHQRLLEQINKLLNAIVAGKDNLLVIGDTFGFLNQYIDEHFADEERYMQEHQYPGLEAHRKLHTQFIEQYSSIRARILAFDSTERILVDLEQHLGRWWIDHIGVADKEYAEYVRTHY